MALHRTSSFALAVFAAALLPIATAAGSPKAVKEAHDYTAMMLGNGHNAAVPRWETPLCVVQYGLDPAGEARFIDQLSKLAATLHVATDHGKCAPNVTIVYSANPAADAGDVATRKAEYIRTYRPEGIDRFRRASDAINWLALPLPTTAEGYRVQTSGRGRLLNSLIDRPTRSVTVEVFVIVDAARARSMSSTQLFDSLTMIVLAAPRIGGIPRESVLTLADKPPTEAPPEMTREDRAYLSALSDVARHPDLSHQRDAIEARMADALG